MNQKTLRAIRAAIVLAATLAAPHVDADVLFGNLPSNYSTQQTGSYTYIKSNTDYGASGFGEYYNTGYDSVSLTSLSFYGGTSELANASTGSIGDGLTIYFFDASGAFVGPSTISETTLTQGIGLHTLNLTDTIPGAGYIMFTPSRVSNFNVQTGQGTPLAPGPATYTAFFGAAPTSGQSNPTLSELEDTNRNLSTVPSLSGSTGYLQIEIDGTGSGASYYPTATPIWNPTGSGTWDNASNWTLGLPDAAGSTANFAGSITAGSTVTLLAAETVGIVNFDSPNSYTLAGAGLLTLRNSSGPAVVNSWAGSQTIATPLAYIAGLNVVTLADPSPTAPILTLPLSIQATGVLTKTGPGTLAFAAPTNGIDVLSLPSINLSAGKIELLASGVNGTRTLLETSGLSIAGGTVLNIGGNDLDLSAGSLTAIRALIMTGYASGAWNGPGIDSSSAAVDTAHLTAIGVIQNNKNGLPVFTAGNQFDGFTPGPSDILVKFTYYGDANLDGKVDGSDYSLIDQGYVTHATGWLNGDFNYDGVVDGSDYSLIDNAFNNQGVGFNSSMSIAVSTSEVAGGPVNTVVPEPTSIAVIGLAALCLVRRHWERKSEQPVVGHSC